VIPPPSFDPGPLPSVAAVFIMLTSAFIRYEIDAINENGVKSKKAATGRAKGWRSFTDSTFILIFGEASKNSWTR
jgi:hypothetical protein